MALSVRRWDAATGAARVDYYGGATSVVRTMTSDGGVQRIEVHYPASHSTNIALIQRPETLLLLDENEL